MIIIENRGLRTEDRPLKEGINRRLTEKDYSREGAKDAKFGENTLTADLRRLTQMDTNKDSSRISPQRRRVKPKIGRQRSEIS